MKLTSFTRPGPSPWASVLLVLALGLELCQSEPVYTIVAPNKLRPNSDYHMSLQLYNASEPAVINVTLSGPSTSGQFNKVSQQLELSPSETRILNLEIGEWAKGNYKLLVEGNIGSFQFSNSTDIQYEAKSLSIFVQTDKSIYKPGQTVKFRAIIVNPSLVPNVAGSLDIFIKVSPSLSLSFPLYLFCTKSRPGHQ